MEINFFEIYVLLLNTIIFCNLLIFILLDFVLTLYIYIYIYIKDSPLWIEPSYGSEISLNHTFNKEKTWGQPNKNISLTPLKMLIKYNNFLLIHVSKIKLSKNFYKK